MPTYLSPGVFVEEKPAGSAPIEGVGTAVAAFVGLALKGPLNQATLVSNWKQFVDVFGDFTSDGYLAHAVYGYFLNGGGNCYVVRIGANGHPAPVAEGVINAPAAEGKAPARYVVRALDPGRDGGAISVEVADASDGDDDAFKLVVRRGGKIEEQHDNLSASGKGKQSATTAVKAASQLIDLQEASNAPAVRPLNGTTALAAPTPAPARLEPSDYVGDVADRTGFGGLETIDEITMVCVPDVMAALQKGAIDLEGVKAVQLAMIAHCELMADRIAIIDPPPDLNPQAILKWRQDEAGYDSRYAALYWPWVKVFDPASNANVFVPPSGHVAGIWGRNDDSRGVHKAPANEVMRGVVAVASDLTSREQELLNPVGINCVRTFAGRGIRVWGARTLSSDPEWRYVNVRRLFNYLEESILNGTQWVVFEPNDYALWARVRRTITAFLTNEWRKGALFGLTPDEAFYVKCDNETNPPEVVDAGQLVCEIGVAPVKPAEFVIFRLAQFSGGAALTE
ncbi:MAG TPA: phage tail sheath subtilisin-like domain-containing protein [Acidimicrobiales bacterium]|jgi:hypothetical protein